MPPTDDSEEDEIEGESAHAKKQKRLKRSIEELEGMYRDVVVN